jgi:hypothetical protein
MHQQLWGYKVEVKIYLGVREGKRLNVAVLMDLMRIPVVERSEARLGGPSLAGILPGT